jgi:hypothetical protein
MNLVWLVSLPSLLCLLAFNVQGQSLIDDTQILDVLIFEHQQKGKKKMVSQGASIKYKLRNNPKVWTKGKLEQIQKDSMTVAGQTIAFSDCLIIAGRVHGNDGIIGGVATGVGLSSVIFGSALIGNVVAGSVLLAGGAGLLTVGIILVTKNKRFHLDKGWEVHHGQLSYSPSR